LQRLRRSMGQRPGRPGPVGQRLGWLLRRPGASGPRRDVERRRVSRASTHRWTSPSLRTGMGASRHGAPVIGRDEPIAPSAAGPGALRTMARGGRRLIPFFPAMYFVAYLDRVNVGFAALQMNAALGLSSQVFGFGAGIFFFGYFLFEIPSNYALARIGARIWIARIAIVWGIVSVAMLFITGP